MEVGEVSAPVEFKGQTGETQYRLIKLQSRTAPHRASLQLDYFKIQQASIEAKKNEFINTWVNDKIYSTFVSIDPLYKGCPSLDKWRNKDVRP